MTAPDPRAGITGIGTYLTDHFHTAEDIADASGIPADVVQGKMGITRKHVPGPDDGTIAMGVRAARAALEDAGAHAEDVDLVVWAGEEYRERPMQTACIKVQKDLGIRRGWGFDMSLRCGSFIAAIKVVRDLMAADAQLATALIVSGYRNSDLVDYRNERSRFMFNLAAGGAAVVVQRDADRNLVRAASIRTDGRFSDDVYVPAGGCEDPLTPEALQAGRQYLDVTDPVGMKERLDALSMDHFVGVVRDALAKSGRQVDDIAYLAILHMKPSAHRHVLETLGVPEERTTYLAAHGHMGQNDPIVSLALARDEGRLPSGPAVLVAAGIGYVWDAIVVDWGP